jgi:hypothetical protein
MLPQIELQSPAANQNFMSGDTIHFEALFTDNYQLLSYVLVIKDSFDDHHKKASQTVAPFSYSENKSLQGSSEEVISEIRIPVDVAAGHYLLYVECTDAVGNEAYPRQIGFTLHNSTDLLEPDIMVTSLSDTTPNNYLAGSTIHLQGTITDNVALSNLVILIWNGSGLIVYEDDLSLQTNPYNLDLQILAPSTPGTYTLRLFCHDQVNNVGTREFQVIVH